MAVFSPEKLQQKVVLYHDQPLTTGVTFFRGVTFNGIGWMSRHKKREAVMASLFRITFSYIVERGFSGADDFGRCR
jgi:hypothetical protein